MRSMAWPRAWAVLKCGVAFSGLSARSALRAAGAGCWGTASGGGHRKREAPERARMTLLMCIQIDGWRGCLAAISFGYEIVGNETGFARPRCGRNLPLFNTINKNRAPGCANHLTRCLMLRDSFVETTLRTRFGAQPAERLHLSLCRLY